MQTIRFTIQSQASAKVDDFRILYAAESKESDLKGGLNRALERLFSIRNFRFGGLFRLIQVIGLFWSERIFPVTCLVTAISGQKDGFKGPDNEAGFL